ncbi:thiosulfohydrolase SoxB [Sinimarinibacterium thermocellulolyticum]|uniref:Thiosulfohydrolase SoxB n=1 Tax=Sinimarinibacterium thermocellulolyticum TaxID=3170016 RepID=A0ABV2AC14_9GAMM
MSRREFVRLLAAAAAARFALGSKAALADADGERLYDIPVYGNVGLLHLTDTHAQLLPIYYREPSVNLGVHGSRGQVPHLVGEALLRHFGVPPRTRQAHALTSLDFEQAARVYGKVGGYAHLATLVKRLRAARKGSLLVDGGDSWQGSATALWTRAQDMVEAQLALGVDVMTGHWEFTLGAERVLEIVDGPFKGRIDFVAQNVKTADFGDDVFAPYALREVNGVAVAIIGQAFPYTPIANPRHFVPDWTFGIREDELQRTIDAARKAGAQLVALLSHNGMDVDLKLAARVRGLDVILGGHTHDAVPQPVVVRNAGGVTLVTNGGSSGKFVGVLDCEVRGARLHSWRYHLVPVFANLLPADSAMQALIDGLRAPFREQLDEPLAVTETTLYRRGNFNGSFDQLILDALMRQLDTPIAFSPGFRWGTTVLPGETITMERLLDQTAITYPQVTVSTLTGEQIKAVLEDVADNLFNPDPYYQQGGDMVRVGGLGYALAPEAEMGHRIRDLRLGAEPLRADKTYRVAGWASVAPNVEGEPVWAVVARDLRDRKSITSLKPEQPRLIGMSNNPGLS